MDDSQLTLVNPSDSLPDRFANTELVFDRDSLTNANLRRRGGQAIQFIIKTADRSMSRTELFKVEPIPDSDQHRLIPMVRIWRGEVLPDTIAFNGGASVRVKKWLKDEGFSVPTADGSQTRYVWRRQTALRELELFNEANPSLPVAWFRTAHRRQIDGVEVQEAPSLSLLSEAEAVQEYVMGWLLLVEQKYRMVSQRANIMSPPMAARSAFSDDLGETVD